MPLTAYRRLLADGIDPRRTVIAGESSGGGLTLSTLMRARDEGVPLPAAAVVLSPWTDLALTGLSLTTNARADPMIRSDEAPRLAALYLAGADPRLPYASPLYGDPTDLPPTLIQVGSDEVLLDDSVRMAERLRERRLSRRDRNLAADAARLAALGPRDPGSQRGDRPDRRVRGGEVLALVTVVPGKCNGPAAYSTWLLLFAVPFWAIGPYYNYSPSGFLDLLFSPSQRAAVFGRLCK